MWSASSIASRRLARRQHGGQADAAEQRRAIPAPGAARVAWSSPSSGSSSSSTAGCGASARASARRRRGTGPRSPSRAASCPSSPSWVSARATCAARCGGRQGRARARSPPARRCGSACMASTGWKTPKPRQPRRLAVQFGAVQQHAARIRRGQPRQQAQHAGLAGAGRAEQHRAAAARHHPSRSDAGPSAGLRTASKRSSGASMRFPRTWHGRLGIHRPPVTVSTPPGTMRNLRRRAGVPSSSYPCGRSTP